MLMSCVAQFFLCIRKVSGYLTKCKVQGLVVQQPEFQREGAEFLAIGIDVPYRLNNAVRLQGWDL